MNTQRGQRLSNQGPARTPSNYVTKKCALALQMQAGHWLPI